MFLSGYKSVRNKLLTSVDLPKPDSPEINKNIFSCEVALFRR